jgi:hypothetical protein
MAIASKVLPKKYDNKEAVRRSMIGKFLNWSKRIWAVERCSTLGITLCPYF